MDWDQDKGIFYFIDTADSVVRSYPVDENGVPKRSTDGVLVGVREASSHCMTLPHLANSCTLSARAYLHPFCAAAAMHYIHSKQLGRKTCRVCRVSHDVAASLSWCTHELWVLVCQSPLVKCLAW